MCRLEVVQLLLQSRDLGFCRGGFGRKTLVNGWHWNSNEPISEGLICQMNDRDLFHLNPTTPRPNTGKSKNNHIMETSLHLSHAFIHLRFFRQRLNLLWCQLQHADILLLRGDLGLGDVELLVRCDGLGFDFLQKLFSISFLLYLDRGYKGILC